MSFDQFSRHLPRQTGTYINENDSIVNLSALIKSTGDCIECGEGAKQRLFSQCLSSRCICVKTESTTNELHN